MKKIGLIIQREFLTRIRKRSFIVLTILGPILLAGLMVVPFFMMQIKDTDKKDILVADNTGLFADKLENGEYETFKKVDFAPADTFKDQLLKGGAYALLYIEGAQGEEPAKVTLYSEKQMNMDIQQNIRRQLKQLIEQRRLEGYDIENLKEILASIEAKVDISNVRWDTAGGEKESRPEGLMAVSYIASFAIYLFIFMFGSMVMNGVIEEKSSRIVEIIVSSVKPFQMMLGKILGIALVGLFQFLIWILLTLGLVTVVFSLFGGDAAQQMAAANELATSAPVDVSNLTSLQGILSGIPFTSVIISFLLYFIGGYLLYAAMFAAIGSAVENEADTQQLVLPVTVPLILGLFIMMHAFQYPDSSLSFWASVIPFTSPMVMMARVPFGVPFWELALSIGVLFATFIVFTWLTGKIYRVGILMYGKKPSFKEMMKWITYKN